MRVGVLKLVIVILEEIRYTGNSRENNHEKRIDI